MSKLKHLILVVSMLIGLPLISGSITYWLVNRSATITLGGLETQQIVAQKQFTQLSRQLSDKNTPPPPEVVAKPTPPQTTAWGCPISVYDNPCFKPRTEPVIHAFMVHYGDFMNMDELKKYAKTIADRFAEATQDKLHITYTGYAIIPLPPEGAKPLSYSKPHNYQDVLGKVPWARPESLDRLWYYYFSSQAELGSEIFEAVKADYFNQLSQSDTIVALTEAQFEAIGFKSGLVTATHQPSEIAWGIDKNYETRTWSEWFAGDEIAHEMGHLMGLQHSSQSAVINDLLQPDLCAKSPNKDDIMSTCRDRTKISETYAGHFTPCTMDYITNQFIPALLKGGYPPYQKEGCP